MADPMDYVKEILSAIEYQSKEYWARKLWPPKYAWAVARIREIQSENIPNLRKIKEMLKEIGDPSFVQPLSRVITRIDVDMERVGRISKQRPTLHMTHNQEYGRFSRMPLEQCVPMVARYPYVKNRQIGNWYDQYERILK